jgi:predicted  nucleic acid-binding Zn-ribbon protein
MTLAHLPNLSELSQHASQLHDCAQELSDFIDRTLDRYHHNPQKATELLKQLVSLRNETLETAAAYETHLHHLLLQNSED